MQVAQFGFTGFVLGEFDQVAAFEEFAEAPRVQRFQMVADERLRPLAFTAPERHPRIDEWPALKKALEAVIRV